MTNDTRPEGALSCTLRALSMAAAAALWLLACVFAVVAAALAAVWAAALWAQLLGATADWTVTQLLLLWGPPTAMSSVLCAAAVWRGCAAMGRSLWHLQGRAADRLAARIEGRDGDGRE